MAANGTLLPSTLTKSDRWLRAELDLVGAFVKVWLTADPDGEGRDVASPCYWSRQLGVSEDAAGQLLDRLDAAGFIVRYTAEGGEYLLLPDHFLLNRERYATCRAVPLPPLDLLSRPELTDYARGLASINWHNQPRYTGEAPADKEGRIDKSNRPRHKELWREVKNGANRHFEPAFAQCLRTSADCDGHLRSSAVSRPESEMEMEADAPFGSKSADLSAVPGPAEAAGAGAPEKAAARGVVPDKVLAAVGRLTNPEKAGWPAAVECSAELTGMMRDTLAYLCEIRLSPLVVCRVACGSTPAVIHADQARQIIDLVELVKEAVTPSPSNCSTGDELDAYLDSLLAGVAEL